MVHQDFNPRSPRGERPLDLKFEGFSMAISIHALLAESDPLFYCGAPEGIHFNPRSPRGERLTWRRAGIILQRISIHALLAESDSASSMPCGAVKISIHALLAESDF